MPRPAAADAGKDELPTLDAPLYSTNDGDDDDYEDYDGEAADREAARRAAAAVRVDGPDGPVSAALLATGAILALFLAAGFLP